MQMISKLYIIQRGDVFCLFFYCSHYIELSLVLLVRSHCYFILQTTQLLRKKVTTLFRCYIFILTLITTDNRCPHGQVFMLKLCPKKQESADILLEFLNKLWLKFVHLVKDQPTLHEYTFNVMLTYWFNWTKSKI